MRTNAETGGVIVTTDSRALKRAVGATAWAVLEDVLLDARLLDGRCVARTSVRLVALHLGLTPGTVARALARLCPAGLVHREDCRDGETGRFSESVYVVHPTPALCPCVDSPDTDGRDTAGPHTAMPGTENRHADPPPVTIPPRGGRRRRGAEPAQLPLLGYEPRAGAPTPSTPPTPSPTNPSNSNPQTPTTHYPNHEPSSSTHPLNPTPQRWSDSCHPSGRALPGVALFSREAG